jgi:hypothetical protein
MTRTAIRHSLSALAALALVSAFATSPASAQQWNEYLNQLQWSHGQLAPRTPRSIARPDIQKGLSLSDDQNKPARRSFKPAQPQYGDMKFSINEHAD